MTLQEWWDYIKSDKKADKVGYLLRNYNAIGHPLYALMDFLAEQVPVVCHHKRFGSGLPGVYSIETEGETFIFRVAPTTPGLTDPIPRPSVLVTDHFLAKVSEEAA